MAKYSFSDSEQPTYGAKPGTYHVVVTAFNEEPEGKEGVLDALEVEFQILAGTEGSEIGVGHTERFFRPDYNDTPKGGNFKKLRLTRLFLATGLATKASLGKEDVEIDIPSIVGKQLYIKLAENEWQGRKTIRIGGADLWQVDDPAVAKLPRGKAGEAEATKAGAVAPEKDPFDF